MSTVLDLIARRLHVDPGNPFVTFYDDATGERTELSVKTWANWVAKTANLYVEELMLDPGDEIQLELPPHWLGTIFVAATWACGLEITGDAPVAIVGPGDLTHPAATIMASALNPFATPFRDPLPTGVLDHGVLWAGQSDFFTPGEQTDLGEVVPDDRRVITDLNPLSEQGRSLVAGLLAGSGSLVLVANPDDGTWPAHSQNERTTAAVRTDQPIS